MADGNRSLTYGAQVAVSSWEASFHKAFDAICQQFWGKLQEKQRQSTLPAPVTQLQGIFSEKKNSPRRGSKMVQRNLGYRGITLVVRKEACREWKHVPVITRGWRDAAQHDRWGNSYHLHRTGLCIVAMGIA
ncbi:Hypothetical predicted protein [Pelobates cultripes]|uniref:Uncharacterized protein n=1 Tax=Pelobates cultripes TaxID=61616 RepID=A0AAD1SKK5_PELCU|nr:Hypothetical predicted protein [Pelobates cultripes]